MSCRQLLRRRLIWQDRSYCRQTVCYVESPGYAREADSLAR
ncbi:hypothetical protein FOCG_18450 [Fusarium oxysporum f. sp. radicis-lycopersici 26381]|nr:hypothetical protein FOCG_18450 [Fusarium oxysporum f. sp. radicis-lycopersici 26381]